MAEFHLPKIYFHKPTGRARVRINGHDVYLGAYGSPEAAEAYARLVAELAAGNPPPSRRVDGPSTVAQVCSQWSDHMATLYPADSREPRNYRLALAVVLKLYGSTLAKDFDPPRLMAVQRAMAEQGWARNNVNRQTVRVRTVWRWAESRKLVPAGTWYALRTVPGLRRSDPTVKQTSPRQAASWDDVKAVLRHCNAKQRDMVLVMWWSGCRSSEVRRLNVQELDRSGKVWLYRPGGHKNAWRGQERVIALGPKSQAVLRRWLREVGPAGWLFPGLRQRPMIGDTFARALREASERAGVKVTAYQVRHSAKLRFTRKYGLDAARAVLGQTSLGATNAYSTQQDEETARRVAGEMG